MLSHRSRHGCGRRMGLKSSGPMRWAPRSSAPRLPPRSPATVSIPRIPSPNRSRGLPRYCPPTASRGLSACPVSVRKPRAASPAAVRAFHCPTAPPPFLLWRPKPPALRSRWKSARNASSPACMRRSPYSRPTAGCFMPIRPGPNSCPPRRRFDMLGADALATHALRAGYASGASKIGRALLRPHRRRRRGLPDRATSRAACSIAVRASFDARDFCAAAGASRCVCARSRRRRGDVRRR